jgi:hypothetical protein
MTDATDDMKAEPDFETEAYRLRGRVAELEAENARLVDIFAEVQGVGALPHDGVGYMSRRIVELEAALEQIARPGCGIELHDSDECAAKYWADQCEELRQIAREVLKK